MSNVLTPEVVTAVIGALALVLVAAFPALEPGINQIRDGIVFIVIAFLGALTARRVSLQHEASRIEQAHIEAQAKIGTYSAMTSETRPFTAPKP